ncbi:MAG: phosphate ABC transporter substrate-binding protein [Actinomycetota bacterium]|nr:phosphate ABC transporter substrate-binding protein [Actinomycetota bacterium]
MEKRSRFLSILIVAVLIVAALAGGFAAAGYWASRNEITYTGSSTIGEHIIPEAFIIFSNKTGTKIGSIEVPGSGKGIKAVIDGKAPLAGSSRPLKPEEEQQGIESQPIGFDALGVFVNNDNPVKNLSKSQVIDIFTGKIKNWREVGGPDKPISVITEILGQARATMLEFQELAMDGQPYTKARKEVDRPADQVAELQKNSNGIISVSAAFSRPGIRELTIGGISISNKTVNASGTYPYTRPLVLVTKQNPPSVVQEFLDFMASSRGQEIVNRQFYTVK